MSLYLRDRTPQQSYLIAAHALAVRLGGLLVKGSAAAEKSYSLAGKLYKSQSGWILLSVPNAIVRGAFDALHEVGVELPLKDGKLEAHISVMNPSDLASIKKETLSEQGHSFSYSLGDVRVVEPDGQSEYDKCWFISVTSPELEKLRKSYGLSALPNDGQYAFHITFGYRRRKVTRPGNEITKKSQALLKLSGMMATDDAKEPADREDCPHCGTLMERGDNGYCNTCGEPWPAKTSSERAADGNLVGLLAALPRQGGGSAVEKSASLSRLLKISGARPKCPGCSSSDTRCVNYSFDEYACNDCDKAFTAGSD